MPSRLQGATAPSTLPAPFSYATEVLGGARAFCGLMLKLMEFNVGYRPASKATGERDDAVLALAARSTQPAKPTDECAINCVDVLSAATAGLPAIFDLATSTTRTPKVPPSRAA